MILNKKHFSKKCIGTAVKATLPFLAMLGGGAVASTRNQSASVGSRRLEQYSAVFVMNDKNTRKINDNTENNKQQEKVTKKRSAFAAFSHVKTKKTEPAKFDVNNSALQFLKTNNLLSSEQTVKAELSGNTLGRKTFAHTWNLTNTTDTKACVATAYTQWVYSISANSFNCALFITTNNYTSVHTLAACQAQHDRCDGIVVTNSAPEFDDANDTITLTLNEDASATAIDDGASGIAVTDTDVGDTLTWSQGSTPSKGTTSISGTRSATGNPGDLPATYTYTPTANANGPDNFTVNVNDGNGGTDTIAVNVVINDIADITSDTVPANNTYGTGDNLDFTITFDEPVTVTGTPRVALNIGGTTKYATYTSGSPGSTLTFRYSIEAGLNDSDGISVTSSIALNSGTIADTDGDGSGADLTNVSFAGTAGVLVNTFDSDGNLTSAGGVSEPLALALSADTVGEAVDLFDFTLSDDGTLDGAAMGVSEIVINVSGTTSDVDRAKVTWRLNGPDVSNVIGVYSSANKTITFSGLSVSIANGASEVYTINAYYNNTGLTHGTTIILSVDGNSDLIVTGGGTSMGTTSAVTNGSGTIVINDTASIGDFIWNDINGDGVQDGGEAGIDGVTLDLYADNDSSRTITGGDTLLATATTAGGGAYDFAGLTPGDYIVDITDTGTVLTGLLLTGGVNPFATSLIAGGDENGADFGYRDNVAPVISAVSIPDSVHIVGDTVTATITVTADTDDYTTISGTISGTIDGYTLGSLSKTNDTSYTATFTIVDGGTDIAAASDVPDSFTLTDSAGNTSTIFNTAISQTSDAIYANVPDVNLTASSNTLLEDGGTSTLTAVLSSSLNNQWPAAVTVGLAYSGTGSIITDYTGAASITVLSGNSTGNTIITGVADSHFDAAVAETIIVDINSLSVGNEGATNQQTLNITDAESAPTTTLSAGNAAIAENGGTSAITATLNAATYENVIVNLAYSGSATLGGVDANTPSASITIPAGATSANTVTGITSINDPDVEGAETIIIDIASVTGGSATENLTQQKTVTITDDDIPLVDLSVSPAAVAEAAGASTVTATLTKTTFEDVVVTLGYSGAAADPADYTKSNTITVTSGQLSGTMALTAEQDVLVEVDESIIIDITGVAGGAAVENGVQQQTVTITDDDIAHVTLSVDNSSISEAAGVSTITAALDKVSYENITVNLTYSGSASNVSDYTHSASITILAGQMTGTAVLTAVSDTLIEGDESIIVDITGVSGGKASENGTQQQTVTISDDDVAKVALSVSSTSMAEAGGSSTISATLDKITFEDVTITLAYSGSATNVSDYTRSASITILAGQMTGTAILTAVSDIAAEGTENIVIDIASVAGGRASEDAIQQQIVTITDDDVVNVDLSVSPISIAETAEVSTITATLDKTAFEDVIVSLVYSGSATNISDYTRVDTITIPAGQTIGSAVLTAVSDAQIESDESIIVDIDSVAGGGALENGVQQQTVTITDDDIAHVTLSVDNSSITETAGVSTITATLDKVTFEDVIVTLAYSGSATNITDYSRLDTITILAGETTGSAVISSVSDIEVEGDESIIVDIESMTGGNAIEDVVQQQAVTIMDGDTDGVPSAIENQVPNAGDNGSGDGNGDSLSDAGQSSVASLQTASANAWVTIENIEGHNLFQVSVGPAPADAPADAAFPFGVVNFIINEVTPGETVTMRIIVDYDPTINDYMKLNHLTDVWDSLGATVTHIGTKKTEISFQLTDGDAYDADGLADGSINDPGGPVSMAAAQVVQAIPALGGLGLGIIVSLLALFGTYLSRRRS